MISKSTKFGATVLIGLALTLSLNNILLRPDASFDDVETKRTSMQTNTNADSDVTNMINQINSNYTSSFSTTDGTMVSVHQFLNGTTQIQPKQFEKYNHTFPCLPKSYSSSNEGNDKPTGLYYIKVFKTASSTVAHIVKYIANKRGSCKEHSDHAAAHTLFTEHKLHHHKPNQPKSFLFTFIREPTKRAVSDFFYRKVTQEGEEVNLDNFKNGCCRTHQNLDGQAGFQLAYISLMQRLPEYTFWNNSHPTMIQQPNALLERVNNVFDSYDFVGVSDRLNESLVALSFILNLSLSEIAYVSYRQSGSYLEVQKKCVKIVKPQLTKDVEEFLNTDEWKAMIAGDTLLHKAANIALDRTIDNVIGRDTFVERLREYESLIELMKECGEECSSTCSTDGLYREATSCRPCMNSMRSKWNMERNS